MFTFAVCLLLSKLLGAFFQSHADERLCVGSLLHAILVDIEDAGKSIASFPKKTQRYGWERKLFLLLTRWRLRLPRYVINELNKDNEPVAKDPSSARDNVETCTLYTDYATHWIRSVDGTRRQAVPRPSWLSQVCQSSCLCGWLAPRNCKWRHEEAVLRPS
jgi:hypothetical protein